MTTEELMQEHSRPLLLELEYADQAEPSTTATKVEREIETPAEHTVQTPSKKDQIIALFEDGTTDIAEIVRRVSARPSYVAQVLQAAGYINGYFDLYTTTGREQNVYTRFFRNVLSFKSVAAAEQSVQKIDRLYSYFERLGDRAGQHHAMVLALTGKNRARWSGKLEESQVFHEWLAAH